MLPETVRTDMIDYPTGFKLNAEIGNDAEAHLHPQCSAVQTNGALLCDCGAIAVEWAKRGGERWAAYVPAMCMDEAKRRIEEAQDA